MRFGVGVEVETGPFAVFLDVQRHLGLRDMDPNTGVDETMHIRGWTVSAGVMYRLSLW